MGHVHFGAAYDVLSGMMEQRRKLATCSGCGKEAWLIPQTLHFSIHEPVQASWCSGECQQKIVQRVVDEAHAYRDGIGDLVETAMVYLRKRQLIPNKLRYALTDTEYAQVKKRCHDEYKAARQAVVSVLLQKVQSVGVAYPLPIRSEPEQVEQFLLWEVA